MVNAGLFDDVDVVLPGTPLDRTRSSYASSKAMVSAKFTFSGLPAHASVSPRQGRSALDAVELMNVGVNYMREHVEEDARIHYVITDGGGQPNVVPARAQVVVLRARRPACRGGRLLAAPQRHRARRGADDRHRARGGDRYLDPRDPAQPAPLQADPAQPRAGRPAPLRRRRSRVRPPHPGGTDSASRAATGRWHRTAVGGARARARLDRHRRHLLEGSDRAASTSPPTPTARPGTAGRSSRAAPVRSGRRACWWRRR